MRYPALMARTAVAPERAKLMTLEEWAALDEDIEGELVDGVLEEEEMPNFLHELVVSWLIATLRTWARRRLGLPPDPRHRPRRGSTSSRRPKRVASPFSCPSQPDG